jgi:hypothetical protein
VVAGLFLSRAVAFDAYTRRRGGGSS